MAAGLTIQEAGEFFGVHEVSVDAHRQAERRVDVEGLGFLAGGPAMSVEGSYRLLWIWSKSRLGDTYADDVPAVGYLRCAIPWKPGSDAILAPFSKTEAAIPLPLHW